MHDSYRIDVWWCPRCRQARRVAWRTMEVDGRPVAWPLQHVQLSLNEAAAMREVDIEGDDRCLVANVLDSYAARCLGCRTYCERWPEAQAAYALAPRAETLGDLVDQRRGEPPGGWRR